MLLSDLLLEFMSLSGSARVTGGCFSSFVPPPVLLSDLLLEISVSLVGTRGGRVRCLWASFGRGRERDLGAVVTALLSLFLFLLLLVIVTVLAAATEGFGPETR